MIVDATGASALDLGRSGASPREEDGSMGSVDPLVARMRARREEMELSQRALAKRAGIGHGHLSQIETGVVDPKLTTLRRLAVELDITL